MHERIMQNFIDMQVSVGMHSAAEFPPINACKSEVKSGILEFSQIPFSLTPFYRYDFAQIIQQQIDRLEK